MSDTRHVSVSALVTALVACAFFATGFATARLTIHVPTFLECLSDPPRTAKQRSELQARFDAIERAELLFGAYYMFHDQLPKETQAAVLDACVAYKDDTLSAPEYIKMLESLKLPEAATTP